MRKGPRHGTDEDRTFWELLLNYAECLRAEEGPGGVGRGPLSPLGSATGPSGLRGGTGRQKRGALAISYTKHTSEFRGELKLRCALLIE
ncbi:hypothetical protein NDU88_001569 [Pleurodeles waltl]|uniref:Uncharacterized protein n=1 Tax=Pleurodeles waltl TaxID=8319 RepID=A0AAV7UX47_PLEWA|nr:hypothetical protein NDU88_001569 [Pleurodeles waltl]